MALPELTSEQRAAALARAGEVRKERAEVLKQLKSGGTTVTEIFEQADNPVYGRITAKAIIMHLPGVGAAKATKFFDATGINPKRRVAGLGSRQRKTIEDFAATRVAK